MNRICTLLCIPFTDLNLRVEREEPEPGLNPCLEVASSNLDVSSNVYTRTCHEDVTTGTDTKVPWRYRGQAVTRLSWSVQTFLFKPITRKG